MPRSLEGQMQNASKSDSANGRAGSRTLLVAGLLCSTLVGVLYGCSRPRTINYRLTLEVEVDGTIHTGSGVIGTEWTHYPDWLRGMVNPYTIQVHGEAIAVDLGPRGLLLALLTGAPKKGTLDFSYNPFDTQGILHAFIIHPSGQEWLEALSHEHDAVDVPFDLLPMLVRYTDIHSPHSVQQVDPANLTASFGPGVKLVRATLAITKDPVTHDLDAKVSWVKDLDVHGSGSVGCCSGIGATAQLTSANFKR